MDRRRGLLQLAPRLMAVVFMGTVAAAGFAPAAHADDSGSGSTSQIIGYTVTAEGIGAQFGFNVPGLIPLPNENLIESDVPFARSIVGSGPQVDAIGSPYYPGDILGNFGGLASEFFPPQFPNPGNWPVMARAQYPSNPAYPNPDASFGVNPPASSPVQPTAFAGAAHADQSGSTSSGTLTNLVAGPAMASGADVLKVGSVVSKEAVNLGASTVTATASSVVKAIEIAGMIDITSITSNASSSSDGTTGTPVASLHLGQVTVQGQQAYIDNTGVHVAGQGTSGAGLPTVADLQTSLDNTLAQDGISIRLLDPQQTTNAAEGIADTGGLVISISHAFNVPFVNTGQLTQSKVEPCIDTDLPPPINQSVLGTACLPAGNYTAVTSITLGLARTDVSANAFSVDNTVPTLGNSGSTDLGSASPDVSSLGLSLGGSTTTLGTMTGPTGPPPSAGPAPIVGSLTHFPIRGVPAPVGWVAFAVILCLIFAYPMMLAARWQFLVGRR